VIRTVAAVAENEAHVVSGFRERSRRAEVLCEPIACPLIPAQVSVGGTRSARGGSVRSDSGYGLPPGIWAKLALNAITPPN